MAAHSSILAWRILWTEEPGGLLSMRSHRVGHNWSDLACMHALEKEMAPTLVILPGESQGQRSLVGCCLWGHTESDTTEATAAAAPFGLPSLLLQLGCHGPLLLEPLCLHLHSSFSGTLAWQSVNRGSTQLSTYYICIVILCS